MKNKASGISLREGVNPQRSVRQGLVGGSIGLLLLLTLVLINPSVGDNSYATCLDGVGAGECAVSALTQEVGVTTKTVITLATANQVTLPDITPTSVGATSYASTKLSVSTNSKEGYSIFLQTGTADGSLVGVTSGMDNTSKITNTAKTGVLLSNLETNAYGYALSTTTINDNTTYSHIPTSSTVVYNKPSNAAMGDGTGDYPYGDEYYLAFGTKIGTSLPAGTYAGTVTVSAIANPLTVTSLYDISTMQEMTSSICENTKEHYTKQLVDTRDGKSYWVAKLKDGNCWMTQNLALDITEAGLKASDTDIEEDWDASSDYPPARTNSVAVDDSRADRSTSSYSWSTGNVIKGLPNPALTSKCTIPEGMKLLPENYAKYCSDTGVIEIDSSWNNRYIAHEGNWEYADGTVYTSLIAVDKNTKSYDSHYLIGNYYQWNAATAGFGNDTSGQNTATTSICPKGWQLPTSPLNGNAQRDKSYTNLLRHYYTANGTNIEKATELYREPLYFVRAGMASPYADALVYTGHTYSWALANDGAMAYFDQWTGEAFISPAGPQGKFQGTTIRCVAR